MESAPPSFSFLNAYGSHLSRQNYADKFSEAMKTLPGLNNLHQAAPTSCVTIGPGPGLFEIEFLKLVAPNLDSLTAVESDTDSVSELKRNMSRLLPGVRTNIKQRDIKKWAGPDEPVDLVLSFQSLYCYLPHELPSLLDEMSRSWVKPGGHVVVIINRREREVIDEIVHQFSEHGECSMAEEVESAIGACTAGLQLVGRHGFSFSTDMSCPDDDFLRFYTMYVDRPLAEIRQAITVVSRSAQDTRAEVFLLHNKAQ